MKTGTFIVAMWTLIATSYISPQKIRAGSDAPFLYYYSPEQAAFIVERADGSDMRILANFALTPQTSNQEVQNIITGPGWSPSGEWFVWRETTNYGGARAAYLVSRDGKNRITLLNGLPVAYLAWSPTHDFLIATSNDIVYLINARVLSATKQFHVNAKQSSVRWTPDGQYVEITPMNTDKSDRIDLIALDGTKMTREFYRDGQGCFVPQWSRSGQLAYVDVEMGRKRFIVENFSNNRQFEFDVPQGSIRRIDWSRDENYMLIYASSDCSQPVPKILKLMLLSLKDKRFTYISDSAQLPPTNSYGARRGFASWSPDDGNIAFFNSDDQVFMATVPSLQTRQVSPAQKGSSSFVHCESIDVLAFMWTGTENVSEWTEDIYSYTAGTNTLDKPLSKTSKPLGITPNYFAYSPAMTYLAVTDGKLYIVDQRTHDIKIITVKDAHLNPNNELILGNINQVLWHPAKNWLITLSVQSPYLLNVVNVDGMIQRELTLCSTSLSCFGWLPDVRNEN